MNFVIHEVDYVNLRNHQISNKLLYQIMHIYFSYSRFSFFSSAFLPSFLCFFPSFPSLFRLHSRIQKRDGSIFRVDHLEDIPIGIKIKYSPIKKVVIARVPGERGRDPLVSYPHILQGVALIRDWYNLLYYYIVNILLRCYLSNNNSNNKN